MNTDDRFWSLDNANTIESQNEFYEKLDEPDFLKDTIYSPEELKQENAKRTRIKNKTFERMSFSKTHISGIIFQHCVFDQCLFIGAAITHCEFHNCRFVSTNMYKTVISRTYINPLNFRKCLDKKKHQNIGVHLYQTLFKNSREENQIEFARDAQFLFERWKRYQDVYEISKSWKNLRSKDQITEFIRKSVSYLSRLLWEKFLGSGVRIRYFAGTIVVVITLLSIFNFCFRELFGLMHGDMPITNFVEAVYFTTISLTTLGYGDVVPTTNLGRLIAAFQSVLGFCLFAILASVLFRRFFP